MASNQECETSLFHALTTEDHHNQLLYLLSMQQHGKPVFMSNNFPAPPPTNAHTFAGGPIRTACMPRASSPSSKLSTAALVPAHASSGPAPAQRAAEALFTRTSTCMQGMYATHTCALPTYAIAVQQHPNDSVHTPHTIHTVLDRLPLQPVRKRSAPQHQCTAFLCIKTCTVAGVLHTMHSGCPYNPAQASVLCRVCTINTRMN